MSLLQLPSPIQEIIHHPGKNQGIRLYIKRDDLIHPHISGNKWRKLKFNIQHAQNLGANTLISAGGPWSNHLAALAAAGKVFNLKTVGIIRGEAPPTRNSTLQFCQLQGMELHFISRTDFDGLPHSISHILKTYPFSFYIPLGGDNELGIQGCEEIAAEIHAKFDVVCLPVGTGTTLRGVAQSMPHQRVMGFSALKNQAQHSAELVTWLAHNPMVDLSHAYSGKGFAKSTPELEDFIYNFYQQNKIMLEPVYTGKMMYGVFNLIEHGFYNPGASILCLHTGGLQGLAGFPDLHKRLFTS
jgi:1-aminocyclopropane-1-carboxylate deaminase